MGALFNKTTATGILQISSAQPTPNSDEERELDEEYLNGGVHVDPDADSADDIDNGTQDEVHTSQLTSCVEKCPMQQERSKGRKLLRRGRNLVR